MTCLNHASLAASLAALTVAADAAAASKPKSPAGKRPAVIVIMTDQQTAGAISCAGNPWVRTPAMDALAADGVRFTRAYCPYPLSGPCRAALVTGRMPFEVGAFDNAIRPADADMQAGIGHRRGGLRVPLRREMARPGGQSARFGHGFPPHLEDERPGAGRRLRRGAEGV